MTDLRELIICWQRGWGVTRALPAAENLGPGLRVRGLQSGRDVEYIALTADEDPASLPALAKHVTAEDTVAWLTVPTNDPDRITALLESAGLVLLKRSELLMTTALPGRPHRPPLAPGYHLEIHADDAVLTATVRHDTGDIGAHGTMGVTGPDAIADRIETLPAHRRRGLASSLMAGLATAAARQGATRGILIASEEGQPLYTKLGWQPAATVLIAAGRSPRPRT